MTDVELGYNYERTHYKTTGSIGATFEVSVVEVEKQRLRDRSRGQDICGRVFTRSVGQLETVPDYPERCRSHIREETKTLGPKSTMSV